ncbi:MFS transporter [Jiangella alba]|uniref:Predicted arabinose efflux permease, MFS family n=1 Tax=Jiangella alba TaxID=561176 RepID=A0A1H5PP65_9ACTN|nr:MFS transporter [Jiangella alba]SEF15693.1 Predicted arabinose efflux permease, MFS family [Jiangella alba]
MVAVACVAAAVATTGVQGLAPMLPAMQEALSLDDAEVALFTTAYLLPGVVLGVPAGLLAERFGRRAVLCLSLAVFAVAGLAPLLEPSFVPILVSRAVQGAAFGAILALTITLIGDVLTGPAQAAAQGRRIVAMTAGEAVLPAVAGLLVAVAWYAPFTLSVLAVPVAVWGWFALPPPSRSAVDRSVAGGRAARPPSTLRQVGHSLRDGGILGLQVLAFLRFFFKFALLTYFPLLAVREAGLSVAATGIVLGAASVLGALTAAASGRLLRRFRATTVVAASIVVTVVAFVVLGLAAQAVAVVVCLLAFGAADGCYAVAQNVLVTEAAPPGARAAFVSLTGAVRNLGKLAAPVACGALAVLLPLPSVFLVMAAAGAALAFVLVPVSRLETSLRRSHG